MLEEKQQQQMLPMVSVIMPVRNEAGFIARSVGAALAQDYPPERLEVLVADGMSDDGTREVLAELAAQRRNLRVIDNVKRIVPTGFNAALDVAQGEIIIRVDGHAIVAPDFVRQNVALMAERPEAWSTGGPIVHQARTSFGKAVAVAMAHPLGIGNARHHFSGYEGYGEGVPFPAFRRWVFERVGKFDEALVRNNDDEFNFRVTQAGGKVYISPRVRYTYFVRERVRQLFRQYFQYGFWRIPVIKKHRQPTTVRQLVPTLFYLACFVLLLAGAWLKLPLVAFGLPVLYAAILIGGALLAWPKVGFAVACRVPLAIGILHAGYGFGLAYGLWAYLFRPQAWDIGGRMTAITR